jgi:hypothetical protein
LSTRTHLHVRADLDIADRWLGKVHLPTGVIALEDIARIAIEDLGAKAAARRLEAADRRLTRASARGWPTFRAIERARHRLLVVKLCAPRISACAAVRGPSLNVTVRRPCFKETVLAPAATILSFSRPVKPTRILPLADPVT